MANYGVPNNQIPNQVIAANYGYSNQYPQMQQPMQQQNNINLANARNNAQQRPVDYIGGRYVSDESEIRPNEVDLGGRIGYFPTYDQTKIFAKQWGNNGTINTEVYILAPKDDNQMDENTTNKVMAELAEIKKMLLRQNGRKPNYNKKPRIESTESKGE